MREYRTLEPVCINLHRVIQTFNMGGFVWVLLLIGRVALAEDTCARDAKHLECDGEASFDTVGAVEQFKKEGWAVVKGVLDKEFMEEVRNHVDYLLNKYPEIPGGKILL